MEKELLRVVPIHRALNRPNLFMGCDRKLIMTTGIFAGAMIFGTMELKAVAFAVVIWFSALYVLRQMAKADPNLRDVYMRNQSYQSYYAPNPTAFRIINSAANKRRMSNPWKR